MQYKGFHIVKSFKVAQQIKHTYHITQPVSRYELSKIHNEYSVALGYQYLELVGIHCV